jgi:hypothetical protein
MDSESEKDSDGDDVSEDCNENSEDESDETSEDESEEDDGEDSEASSEESFEETSDEDSEESDDEDSDFKEALLHKGHSRHTSSHRKKQSTQDERTASRGNAKKKSSSKGHNRHNHNYQKPKGTLTNQDGESSFLEKKHGHQGTDSASRSRKDCGGNIGGPKDTFRVTDTATKVGHPSVPQSRTKGPMSIPGSVHVNPYFYLQGSVCPQLVYQGYYHGHPAYYVHDTTAKHQVASGVTPYSAGALGTNAIPTQSGLNCTYSAHTQPTPVSYDNYIPQGPVCTSRASPVTTELHAPLAPHERKPPFPEIIDERISSLAATWGNSEENKISEHWCDICGKLRSKKFHREHRGVAYVPKHKRVCGACQGETSRRLEEATVSPLYISLDFTELLTKSI